MSAEHTGQSPCPCRGCTTAYKAGFEAADKYARQEYRQGLADGFRDGEKAGYTKGYNEAMALHLKLDVMDWVYGKRLEEGIVTVEQAREWNQHGEGENP